MKKICLFFSDLKNIFTFKRGFIFGLYYWIMVIYEFVFVLLPFSRIIGYPSHSQIIDNAYKIYNSNFLILVTIFYLIAATIIFTKFDFADIGAMIWNAFLLILFILFIFIWKNADTNSNIILKTVLSLGTIESLIKNIFSSREAYKRSNQEMRIEINRTNIIRLQHETTSQLIESASLENKILALNNKILILQTRKDILKNQQLYRNNRYIKKPILNRISKTKNGLVNRN